MIASFLICRCDYTQIEGAASGHGRDRLQFRFSSNSQQVSPRMKPPKLLFTGLTKQRYVLWWAGESVVNRSTGGFGSIISLHCHMRIEEKMRDKENVQYQAGECAAMTHKSQYRKFSENRAYIMATYARLYMDLQMCKARQVSKRVIGWICDLHAFKCTLSSEEDMHGNNQRHFANISLSLCLQSLLIPSYWPRAMAGMCTRGQPRAPSQLPPNLTSQSQPPSDLSALSVRSGQSFFFWFSPAP